MGACRVQVCRACKQSPRQTEPRGAGGRRAGVGRGAGGVGGLLITLGQGYYDDDPSDARMSPEGSITVFMVSRGIACRVLSSDSIPTTHCRFASVL